MSNKETTIKTIKGFDSNLQCLGYQYEVGKTYETDGDVKICMNGFHAVNPDASPLNVFDYYPPCGEDGKPNRYCEVEVSGDPQKSDDKIVGRQITIGAEIGIPGLVKAHMEWVKKYLPNNDKTSGDGAQIGSSGDGAQIGSSGNGAKIGSSGYGAQIGSSGDGAQIGSSGDGAKIGSSGDGAKIGSSGYGAQIGSSGDGAVICCAGHGSKVKAKIGSWITLAEWDTQTSPWKPKCVKTEYVDGERIKADTWYTLKAGKFVEAE